MNIDALLGWLLESTLAVSAAALLVLVMRRPVCRLFGAGAAYACWALVPLVLLAVSLPAPVREAMAYAMPLQVGVAPTMQAVPTPVPTSPQWWALHSASLLAAIWAGGMLLMGLVFWHQQRRFVASLGRTRRDATGLLRADAIAGCPAVVGAWSPRIVLPADFEARYPAHEGELVLAHERVHLARQDVRLNLLAVALRCLHWFNPLLHYAVRAYRQDQELACDAAVLARHPRSRRAYADAMLKTQLAVLGLPVGCHWQSSQSLKERILMLKQPLPKRGRTRLGAITVAALLLGATYTAWALQPERVDEAPVQPLAAASQASPESRQELVTVSVKNESVRELALDIAAQGKLVIRNPEVLGDQRVSMRFEKVSAETAFMLIGEEIGFDAVIENGEVRFVPAKSSVKPVTTAPGTGQPIDLRMRLNVDGVVSTPRIVSRSGEHFLIKYEPKPGKVLAATTLFGTATVLADGKIAIETEIRRDGAVLGKPTLHLVDSQPGSIKLRDADRDVYLEIDASVRPERYSDIPLPPQTG